MWVNNPELNSGMVQTINENLYLIPISSNSYTKGYNKTLVLDGYKQEISFIPNILHQILVEHKKKSIKSILNSYPSQYSEQILQYLEFLEKNRLVYFGEKHEIKLFPDFNMEWDFPSKISNAILEIKDLKNIYFENIINQLDEINCFYLQINFLNKIENSELKSFLETINSKSFRTINLTFDSQYVKESEIEKLAKEISKLNRIIVFNAEKNEAKGFEKEMSYIIYSNAKTNTIICREITPNIFSKRIEHFTESQLHNTCLNRKISIDAEGNIKNCPSMPQTYGNIKDTTLQQAIEKQGFKDCWYICKDKIDVCKDCEFRHICTDCRAFIKAPQNIYSQPAKCCYNPYICLWEGQDGYVPVENCGTYNKETGFIPDNEKIEKLNAEIWKE